MIGVSCVLISSLILLIALKSSAEEYNLFGEAGQAYAVEIKIGHPQQKVIQKNCTVTLIFTTIFYQHLFNLFHFFS